MKKNPVSIEVTFNIAQKIEEKSLREGKRIYIANVAKATGITTPTLHRMINKSGNTWIKHVIALCDYFECEFHELVEYKVIKADLN